VVYVFLGCILALNFVAGLCCIGCLLYGQMLCPHSDQGTLTVVWGTGAGEDLERHVRSLMWLQECGLLRCAVMVVDAGLNEEGRALVIHLAKQYPTLALCTRAELERHMNKG